jgi:hypothetical protein
MAVIQVGKSSNQSTKITKSHSSDIIEGGTISQSMELILDSLVITQHTQSINLGNVLVSTCF